MQSNYASYCPTNQSKINAAYRRGYKTGLKHQSNNSQSTSAAAINAAEAQEIFMLEESLANLATLSTTDFGTQNLLSTLDALYLEI